MCACSAQSSATLTQTVTQADPGLAWATPAAIPFGTPLDASTLNASARVEGVFFYDPAPGSIPAPGSQTLSVRFKPANPNFRSATVSTILQVLPPGDSTFLFSLGSIGAASTPGGSSTPVVVRPGHPTVLHIAVMPIRDFHQPISFSCGRAPDPLTCVFSPDPVRPTIAPVDVTLKVTAGPRSAAQGAVPPLSQLDGALLYLPLSLLGALMLRKARLVPGVSPAPEGGAAAYRSLILVIALPLMTMLSGCTWGVSSNLNKSRVLPVTASSLVESRTVNLPYVLLEH
jgi:hypothetical protein